MAVTVQKLVMANFSTHAKKNFPTNLHWKKPEIPTVSNTEDTIA